MSDTLLEVHGLKKHFGRGARTVRAVDGVSFSVARGETLGLVGESGCGKSTLGRTLIGMYRATGGEVLYDGVNLAEQSRSEWKHMRTRMQMIFQDPGSSLNPTMSTGRIIQEALVVHKIGNPHEQVAQVEQILDDVGIGAQAFGTFPYELSGGQQQRVAIARAVALRPEFIICDEAISALDVSIQGQIISLLIDLQRQYGLSYLFISHDLRAVRFVAHRIAVMYLGKIVEYGDAEQVYNEPAHPYSRALLSAVPHIPDARVQSKSAKRIILTGEPPSPIKPPSGCPFHPRCSECMDICSKVYPPVVQLSSGQSVACHLYGQGVHNG